MTVVIAGKLKDAAREFPAGNSTGFGIRIGEKFYDRETRESAWTNYECAVFAAKDEQVDFYRRALIPGAVVQITGEQQKIKSFEGNNGVHLSIEVLNCKLSNVFFEESSTPADSPPPKPAYKPPEQQQEYIPANSAGNGFAPSHPRNATAQQTVASPSSNQPPPGLEGIEGGFDDDIPF